MGGAVPHRVCGCDTADQLGSNPCMISGQRAHQSIRPEADRVRSLPLPTIAASDDIGCLATGATNLGVEAHSSAATAFLCLGDLLLAATPVQWPSMRSPARTTVGHLGERATAAHP